MKKVLKNSLLFVLIVGFSTFLGVTGFYINENQTAVVNWLNNEVVIKNEEYKDIVVETNYTVAQLNEKISAIKADSQELESNKTALMAENEELSLDETTNADKIQENLVLIAEIDTKLEDNEEKLASLRELIDTVYSDMINQIIELPEELQAVKLTFTFVEDNSFFITSSAGIYYFDYSAGKLVEVVNGIKINSYFKVPNGYLIDYNSSSHYSGVHYFNLTDYSLTDSGLTSCVVYHERNNRVYIFTVCSIGYFDYATQEFVTLKAYGSDSPSTPVVNVVGNFAYSIDGKYRFTRLNFDTDEVTLFTEKVYGLNRPFMAKVDGVTYLFASYNSDTSFAQGVYVVDNENVQLVSCSDYVPTTTYTEVYYNHDDVIFSENYKICLFKNGDVTELQTTTSMLSTVDKTIDIYEDEAVKYFAYNKRYLFKYDKTLDTYMFIKDLGKVYLVNQYSENLVVMANGSKISVFDGTQGTFLLETASNYSNSLNCCSICGKYVLLSSSSKTSTQSYLIDMISYTSKTLDSKYFAGEIKDVVDTKVLMLFDGYFTIFDTTKSASQNEYISYDSSKSLIADNIFYSFVETLENGSLYYKYVVAEDLTYTKTLVVVK